MTHPIPPSLELKTVIRDGQPPDLPRVVVLPAVLYDRLLDELRRTADALAGHADRIAVLLDELAEGYE